MNVDAVLSQLITKAVSFPALKLAWNSQIEVEDLNSLPKISPSHYLHENLLSTEERRTLTCKQQRRVYNRQLGLDQLVVEPAVIVFQNYACGDTHVFPVSIRNVSKTYQRAALSMEEDGVFHFDEFAKRTFKFTPGMVLQTVIKFKPQDDQDYYHKLIVRTPTSRFSIPIIGIGGRGLLNISDSIIFDSVPVKSCKTKILPVYNSGSKVAKFTLSATGQFSVKPEKASVLPKENFNLEVSQYSAKTGVSDGHLLIKYDNGEEIYVYLKAEAVEENIELCPPSVACEDTYVGLRTKSVCVIRNGSSIPLDFRWSKYASDESDRAWNAFPSISLAEFRDENGPQAHLGQGDDLGRAIEALQARRNECGDGDNNTRGECVTYPVELEIEEFRTFSEETFLHESFQLTPMIGRIQPYSSAEICVIFEPSSIGEDGTIAYLEITGKEERLPLKLKGNGLGSSFLFGFETLDIGRVIICQTHCYEIPIFNTGHIPGTVQSFGPISKSSPVLMSVKPKSLTLRPQEYGAFYLSMSCAEKPGDFEELLKFAVKDTEEVYYVAVKGGTDFPHVHFEEPELAFGDVSFGFQKTQELCLVNDSEQSINVYVTMDDDGEDPPLDHEAILQSFREEEYNFDHDPAEFFIRPSNFTLPPHGRASVLVTLCANQLRDINQQMVCYMVDEKSSALSEVMTYLPVTGACTIPTLTCANPEVILKDIFIRTPFTVDFDVVNESDIEACYCIVPVQRGSKLRLIQENLFGVLEANCTTSVSCKLTCAGVGKGLTCVFDMFLVGMDEKLFTFTVRVTSILPPKTPAVTPRKSKGPKDTKSRAGILKGKSKAVMFNKK